MRSESPAAVREALLDVLQRRVERGNTYVRTSYIADDVDATPQQIGSNLGVLCDQGYLERWSENANGVIYRIDAAAVGEHDV